MLTVASFRTWRGSHLAVTQGHCPGLIILNILSKIIKEGGTEKLIKARKMAERVGFEPTVKLLAPHTISSRAPSAARTSLLGAKNKEQKSKKPLKTKSFQKRIFYTMPTGFVKNTFTPQAAERDDQVPKENAISFLFHSLIECWEFYDLLDSLAPECAHCPFMCFAVQIKNFNPGL